MRQLLRKTKRILRILWAIILLLCYRIKYIGKPKGIAQVVDAFNNGGLEQVAANIYKAFDQNGKKSYVISLSNNVGPMCQQLRSPAHLRIAYYDLAELIKFCGKRNIRILTFHFTTYHMILFRLLGFKNYYIIHNTYIWYTESEWKKLKFKLKFTKGIIAVSEWCKNYFIKKTGIQNVKMIMNGINLENLNNQEICPITRKSLNIKDNEIVCLTIGSYTEGKHQMGIIGIAEEVIKKNKNIKFICAGPMLDQKYFKDFKKALQKSKAKKNIIVLNYIPQNEIGNFIENICDIYLQPSVHEAGVPLTVMEVLLKGKPVIMTDFNIKETFLKSDRIFAIPPSFKDITKITPKDASKLSRVIKDENTSLYCDKILEIANNLQYFKDPKNFNVSDYSYLSYDRMCKEYLEYIKF